MNNILITSGISAFTQRVAEFFPRDTVFFADSNPIPSVFLNSGKYLAIPSPEKPSFIHEVLKLCLDLSVIKLLPLSYKELIPLAKNRLLFEEYGISILVPDLKSLENIPKLVNPTRVNCPKIIVRQPLLDEKGIFGVFKDDEEDGLTLCCLQ